MTQVFPSSLGFFTLFYFGNLLFFYLIIIIIIIINFLNGYGVCMSLIFLY